jgi:hypothetical protein
MENISSLERGVMKMIDEISISFAVDMARKLHKNGIAMGLAIYKAAKYYNANQHLVAVAVGRESVKHNPPSQGYGVTGKQMQKPKAEQTYWWDNG